MKSFRPVIEKLEGRQMLDAAASIEWQALAQVETPIDAVAVVAAGALDTVQTAVQLVGGQTILLGVAPEDLVGDLSGVNFALHQGAGLPTPEIAGVISQGTYTPDGVLFIEGVGQLQTEFVASSQSQTTRLKSGGSLSVNVEQSEFRQATFAGVEVDVDVAAADGAGPLKLRGMLNEGTYVPGSGITFSAPLELRETFEYTRDSFVARMQSGHVGVKVEQSEFNYADLHLEGEVDVNIPNTNGLKLGGTLSGKYENDLIDFVGTLSLLEPFEYTKESIAARLQSGQVGVNVEQSEFEEAAFAGVEIEFDVAAADAAGPLKFKGTLTNGTYKPSEGITFSSSLDLQEPFVYEKSPVKATMKSGQVGVNVEQSEFKVAAFAGVEIEFDVAAADGAGPLKLRGMLNEGTYVPGSGITFSSSLDLQEPFVYEKSPVKATMKSGQVGVEVEQSEFKSATLNLEGEVDLSIPNTNGLKLGGTISGKYDNGLIDLDCTLSLVKPFEYTRDSFVARMQSGQVGVKVEKSEFKYADLHLEGEVDVNVPNTNGLNLGGTLSGKYENGLIDLGGTLDLRSTWSIFGSRIVTSVLPGQPFATRIVDSSIEVNLQGARFSTRIDLGPATADFGGVIEEGAVRNHRFYFRGSAALATPVVLLTVGRRRLVLMDAKLDLVLASNGVRRIWLHDLHFRWVLWDNAPN